MVGLTKPEDQCTEKDFSDNLNKLFYKDFRYKLKEQTYRDTEVNRRDNGETWLTVSANFNHVFDGFIDEESILLRYKKIDNEWKLFVIFVAS